MVHLDYDIKERLKKHLDYAGTIQDFVNKAVEEKLDRDEVSN